MINHYLQYFFFSSRRRHTRLQGDWSSDVCSSDLPNVGESISEVQIAEWLKRDGDLVKKDENVAVLDSEKTTLELPAPESGRLKILRSEERRVGKSVDLGGRRIIKKKKKKRRSVEM